MNFLCPHKLNPNACLQCFHARSEARPVSMPKPKMVLPKNDIIEAIKERAPMGAAQEQAGPVHLGTLPGGAPVSPDPPPVPVSTEPRTRGKMPVPVLYAPGSAAAASAPRSVEAFSYTNDPGRYDRKGYWRPPRHRDLIDTLPRHPEAGSKASPFR